MSFLDCINTAIESGKITEGRGAEARDAYDEAFARARNEGLNDSVAEARASEAAAEQIARAKGTKRWQRLNDMRAAHELNQRIASSKRPGRNMSVLDDIINETKLHRDAVNDQLLAYVGQFLEHYRPRFAGKFRPIENLDNVVRAYFGEKGHPESVVAMADSIREMNKYGTKLLNLEGASIPKNDNYLWQTLDRFLVRQGGEDKFVAHYMTDADLDWDSMEYHGKPIDPAQRDEILRRNFRSIVTQGLDEVKAGQNLSMSLANRLNRERFFIYKSADGWLATQKLYGKGDLYTQLLHHADSTSQNVALMRSFGPNTETGKQFAIRAFEAKEGGQLAANPKDADARENNMRRAVNRFQGQYDIFARNVDMGQGDVLVQALSTARTVVGTGLLGAMALNAMSDPFYGMWSRSVKGLPWMHVLPAYAKSALNFRNLQRQMVSDAITIESVLSRSHEYIHNSVSMEAAAWAHTLSDANYRLQGTAALTDIGRFAAGQDLQKALGFARDLKFDEVPFVDTMRNLGITEEDWKFAQSVPLYEPEYFQLGKGTFLRPLDMVRAAEGDAQRSAANKFMMLQEAFVRDFVPSENLRARYLLGADVTPTRWAGQVIRASAQLTLFPASIMFNHWRQIAAAPNWGSRIWRAGTFFAATTAAGAFIGMLKDALYNGRNPQLPIDQDGNFNKDWLWRSMALGGGGAILGDWLYNNVLSSNSSLSASTPTADAIDKFVGLTAGNVVKAINGKEPLHVAGDAEQFVWGLLPKPWPIKLVAERMILDPLMEWSDPAAYQRKLEAQAKREQQTGQTSWWGPQSD